MDDDLSLPNAGDQARPRPSPKKGNDIPFRVQQISAGSGWFHLRSQPNQGFDQVRSYNRLMANNTDARNDEKSGI